MVAYIYKENVKLIFVLYLINLYIILNQSNSKAMKLLTYTL